MAGAQTGIQSDESRAGKLEDIILLVFCALVAVGGLAVVVWQLVMGRLLSIDGLCLAGICLTLSGIFGGNVAWSVYNGELKQILGGSSKKPPAAPGPTPSGPK
jgi:hypothetical protein